LNKRYPFKYLSYRSLSIFCLVFLHIPDILFSVLPLNLLVCASSREPCGYCAICGFCARFAIDVNMKCVLLENATDIFLSVFKITKNFWQINSTIQHHIRFYMAYYIKHFLSVPQKSKSVHFQYNGLFNNFTFINKWSSVWNGPNVLSKSFIIIYCNEVLYFVTKRISSSRSA
jgi:hypothetical protein